MACFPTQPDRTPRRATGAHDPCLAKALVLDDGRETVALCSLDVTAINAADVQRIREAVAAESPGLAADRIVVAATHTHSSPETMYLFGATPDDPWMEEFRQAVVAAIVEAHERAAPARIGLGTAHADLNFNRRVMVDGRMTLAHSEPPGGGQGPTDPELAVLRVDYADGRPLAMLVHYTAHPLVIGPGSFVYSADFPGVMRRHLEITIGGGIESLFVNGAAGNIHPKTAVTLDWDEVERMGTRLGEEALTVYRATATDLEPSISYQREVLRFPHRADERLQVDVEIGVLRLGDAVFAVVPGEFFVEFQLDLKRASRTEKTLLIGFANDSLGYVPDRDAYRFGGYGVDLFEGDPPALNRTRIPPGAGEAIVERLVSIINGA